jgi:hypothetical protein
MDNLLTSIKECSFYEFYGFRGNFCTWEWNWSIDTNEAIAFHVFLFALYAFTVKALQLYVNSVPNYKPPSWLDSIKFGHNIALALVSAWMFFTLLYVIILDGRFDSWQNLACKMTPMHGLYGFANFIFLVSKIWEWCDTYFLILSNKKVIYLHWFHHMTTFAMAALTHHFPVGGFTLINCVIHAVMYAHYAKPLHWARPFITSSQLLQFVYVMSIHTYTLLNPVTCYDVRTHIREWAYLIGVVFPYFIMFSMFFIEEYLQKGNKKGKSSKKIE